MSEISEEQAREAARRVKSCRHEDDTDPDDPYDDCFPNAHKVYGCKQIEACIHVGFDLRTLSDYAMQELTRRDAELAERGKPITPKWCLANGAAFSASWYWFDEGVSIRPIAGGTWLVAVSGQMLNWSAECVGQVEDLRKALRGGA